MQKSRPWPPALLATLKDHLPAPIAEVVLRRGAAQARLGPEAWETPIQRRRLIEALCARATVFLELEQVVALRKALLAPASKKPEPAPEQFKYTIRVDSDVLSARQGTIELLQRWSASTIARTRAATIVSELARNIFHHAGRGTVQVSRSGDEVCIVAEDQGPGIPEVQALLAGERNHPGTGGLGLLGSRRLAESFEIQSAVGKGTRITASLRLQ